ncbi:HK97 gp10 family phage protein [uncultured Clostridium sp.]|uniref:HK97 gp10 family phage protein n=1 Tax=uncultured Clostridium sp. TaxID=59620 RepID=UPI0025CBAFD8|nr:HK97 gp10 family phage protein [uncultured Clostridium sp.]
MSNINDDMERLAEEIKQCCIEVLEESATEAVAEIKAMTPVGFGILRRSITHDDVDKSNLTVDVGSNIQYAPYVEEGYTQKAGQYVPVLGKKLTGKHIQGAHMIRDGLTVAENKLEDKLKQKLQERFGRI